MRVLDMGLGRTKNTLTEIGALVSDGHFVYSSGLHGDTYVDKDTVFAHPKATSRLCRLIAEQFRGDMVEAVASTPGGGQSLTQWIAYHLSIMTGYDVYSLRIEKMPPFRDLVLAPSHAKHVSGKRVLVIEDILNSGSSAYKVLDVVRSYKARVVGVGAIVNRGEVTAEDLCVPKLVTLLKMELTAYGEGNCPLCAQGVPINTELGHGKEFLAREK